ncbi:MAG: hypothetical protein GY847_00040 [Proteobacteria bacterium]|nr:hypothetical protein [Pseudomonadota bacterium]
MSSRIPARCLYFLVLVVIAISCGPIDSPDNQGEPLWTIKGNIVNIEQGLEFSNLRAAFLWDNPNIRFIAQDISLNTEFPAKFTLDLFELPPEKVMQSAEYLIENEDDMDEDDEPDLDADTETETETDYEVDGGEKFLQPMAGSSDLVAVAYLVVYDDRNSNGNLDMLSIDANELVDYVLGPGEFYNVVFLESDNEMALADDLMLDPGLNIFCDGCDKDPNYLKISLENELAITLVDDPELQPYMCEIQLDDDGTGEYISSASLEEIPQDAEINCSEDGYSLTFSSTNVKKTGGDICGSITTTWIEGDSSIPKNQPVPDGWPCKITE